MWWRAHSKPANLKASEAPVLKLPCHTRCRGPAATADPALLSPHAAPAAAAPPPPPHLSCPPVAGGLSVRQADTGLKCCVQDGCVAALAEALPPAKQRLYYGGRLLQDDQLLEAVRLAQCTCCSRTLPTARAAERPHVGIASLPAVYSSNLVLTHPWPPLSRGRLSMLSLILGAPTLAQCGVRHDERLFLEFESPCIPDSLRRVRDLGLPAKGKGGPSGEGKAKKKK